MGVSIETKRAIFMNFKIAGIKESDRHDLQLQVVGKSSLRKMSETEGQKLLVHLRTLSQDHTSKRGFKHLAAPRADLRYIHVLWGLLGKAGELTNPSREGLNTFIRSRFENTWGTVPLDIDMLREHEQIDDVIQALKSWCERADIEYEL